MNVGVEVLLRKEGEETDSAEEAEVIMITQCWTTLLHILQEGEAERKITRR
jgi:hypothetical protein